MPSGRAKYHMNSYGPMNRVSLELPAMKTGRKRLPDAVRQMAEMIRARQNAIADFMDLEGEYYDWKGELSKRWYPGNGAYYPEVNYKNRVQTKSRKGR